MHKGRFIVGGYCCCTNEGRDEVQSVRAAGGRGDNWEGKTVAASGGLMVEVGAVYKKTSHKISVGG